ncbi:MAG TPA: hypothetical protein PKA20_29935 [Burkholderiaceae bacterium]|nr:hypothetical protein [Burkholderiaceae bacterium]
MNGTYQAYSTEGVQVPIEFDFDARTLKAGSAAAVAFSADAGSTNQFTIAGNEVNAKFRVADDLIVGNVNLGGGVLPFIAARKFVTTIAELGGSYNTLARSIAVSGGPPAGTLDSRIQSYGFTNGKLLACQDNIPYTVADCPSGSLWTFDLTVSGDEFLSVDTVHNVTGRFRVAKSGNTTLFMSAGPNEYNGVIDKRMRIGLPERAGIVAGTYVGGTTTTSWSTATVTTSSFTQVIVPAGGGSSLTTGATLTNPGTPQYPTGLMGGTRTHDGAPVFAIGNDVLWAYAGARGGLAQGYLTFGVR